MNFDTDLHIHTFHSPCGMAEMLPHDIVRLASARGMKHIGITDHFYPFSDPAMFDDVRLRLNDALSGNGNHPRVYLGCEAEVMSPGRTTATPELAERLDFLMVAATHFQNRGITDLPETSYLRELAEYYVKMFGFAVSIPWADVLAHPFLVIPDACSPEVLKHIEDRDLLPLLETARDNDVAMEISPRALFPWQVEFSTRFYKLCKRVGLMFTTGSDAHSLENVGNVRVLRPLITEIGLCEKDFWRPEVKEG